MNDIARHPHRLPPWCVPLLAAAMLLRMLVAPGLMPDSTPGGPAFVLCAAQGAVRVDPGPAGHSAAKPCPFEALSAAALAPELPAVVLPQPITVPLLRATIGRALAPRRIYYARPPSHAPPAGSAAVNRSA